MAFNYSLFPHVQQYCGFGKEGTKCGWGTGLNFVTSKIGDIFYWSVYEAFFLPYTVSELSQPTLQLGIKSRTFSKSAWTAL